MEGEGEGRGGGESLKRLPRDSQIFAVPPVLLCPLSPLALSVRPDAKIAPLLGWDGNKSKLHDRTKAESR